MSRIRTPPEQSLEKLCSEIVKLIGRHLSSGVVVVEDHQNREVLRDLLVALIAHVLEDFAILIQTDHVCRRQFGLSDHLLKIIGQRACHLREARTLSLNLSDDGRNLHFENIPLSAASRPCITTSIAPCSCSSAASLM